MTVFLCPVPFVKLPGGGEPIFVSNGPYAEFVGNGDATFPDDVANGQLALIIGVGSGNTTSWHADGFTVLSEGEYADSPGVWLAYKICDGTEGGTTASIDVEGSSGFTEAVIAIFSSVLTSGDPTEDVSAASGASTSETSNSTTTSGANRLGVRIYVQNDDRSSTVPAGWTEEFALLGSNYSTTLDTKLIPSATTEAATTRTIGGFERWVVIDLALKPTAG